MVSVKVCLYLALFNTVLLKMILHDIIFAASGFYIIIMQIVRSGKLSRLQRLVEIRRKTFAVTS